MNQRIFAVPLNRIAVPYCSDSRLPTKLHPGSPVHVAVQVFPEGLRPVTDTLTSASSPVPSVTPTPPVFGDVSHVSADPKELAEYTLQAASQEELRRRQHEENVG